jgi:DNA-binding response OmpR family regulator
MDFIPKPFLLQELFLKIDRALGEKQEAKSQWTLNGTTLDLHKRQITTSKDTHLLNKRDFRLLKILVQKAPEVVSRDEIIDYVYGKDQNPSHRTVDNAVVGIRQMLLDEDHEWIRSVRGEGYLWALKGENS